AKYCDSSVPNYEVENADESVNENADESENYITFEEKIYTTDKFIEFLKKDTHYIDDDFSHQFENICEDIRALQRNIKDVKYGRDHNIYGGVHCIDGVWADDSHQNLCRNSFSFQIRAEYKKSSKNSTKISTL
ncbi:7170_t:CDS:1, partial [Racocetra fulgida]